MTISEAIRARDVAALRAAINEDAKTACPARAVCEAGRMGWREGFELLHKAGADLNASYRNYPPLHSLLQEDPHAAAGKPSTERIACLEWLLEHGADCNVPDEEGRAAVHQAASRGNERALLAVLEAGGDRTRRDSAGQAPRDLTRKDKIAELLRR